MTKYGLFMGLEWDWTTIPTQEQMSDMIRAARRTSPLVRNAFETAEATHLSPEETYRLLAFAALVALQATGDNLVVKVAMCTCSKDSTFYF